MTDTKDIDRLIALAKDSSLLAGNEAATVASLAVKSMPGYLDPSRLFTCIHTKTNRIIPSFRGKIGYKYPSGAKRAAAECLSYVLHWNVIPRAESIKHNLASLDFAKLFYFAFNTGDLKLVRLEDLPGRSTASVVNNTETNNEELVSFTKDILDLIDESDPEVLVLRDKLKEILNEGSDTESTRGNTEPDTGTEVCTSGTQNQGA